MPDYDNRKEEAAHASKARIGSVSSGTMRAEDLVPAFMSVLRELSPDHKLLTADVDDQDEEELDDLVVSLFDALEEFAPPYCYFGAHPGDGSDYGFWVWDDIQQQMDPDTSLIVEDTAQVPADFVGEVLLVSDHGNMTLFNADRGALTEVWSIV